MALIGITIERNVISSSRNARLRTKPKTIGQRDFMRSLKSLDPAVMPGTYALVPAASANCGTTSPRGGGGARFGAALLPLPAIGRSMDMTWWFGEIDTSIGFST